MSFRTFFVSISASFGIAWLAIIIVPYFEMRAIQPVSMGEEATGTLAVYIPKRAGRVADGSLVYAQNGCYLCHSQLIRPDYAGTEVYRPDFAGYVNKDEGIDTRRESNVFDYAGERFAHIGVARLGPDLSNLAVRVEKSYAKDISPENWLYRHLYDPRYLPERRESGCPSYRFLFSEKKVTGNPSDEALPFKGPEGGEMVPSRDARALVSYLLSLKKDHAVPAVFDFSPADTGSEKATTAP
ncbi:MAG: hypothetical protein RL346_1910 [Verrucomicrobiota bacterium]|jgi:cytochrome c oxidase cbb3-type subunit 2